MPTPVPAPTELKLHRASRVLDVAFADGRHYALPCEYLRVFSPSAEVQGHGTGETVLVPGKQYVDILRIEPVGHYAVRLTFNDGHNTGLYTWPVLRDLGENQASNWANYLQRMEATGLSRDPSVVRPLSALLKKSNA
ncbi:MAG: gamma-butyrobetaine hydroxylase-like domain-containing protein [Nevskiales bacterium]